MSPWDLEPVDEHRLPREVRSCVSQTGTGIVGLIGLP